MTNQPDQIAACEKCGTLRLELGEDSTGEGKELRCACGSLLARLAQDALELKCRRCRRTVVVQSDGDMLGEPAPA